MSMEAFDASEHPNRYLTVPNALSVGRLAATPFIANKLAKNPRRWWAVSALIAASDSLDGYIARKFDQKSEFGRKIDPVADKIYGAANLVALTKAEVVPKPLAGAMLAQKAFTASTGIRSEIVGADLHVSKLGRIGEFLGAAGVYTMAASESFSEQSKNVVKRAGTVLAVAGMAVSTMVAIDYHRQINDHLEQQSLAMTRAFMADLETLGFNQNPDFGSNEL